MTSSAPAPPTAAAKAPKKEIPICVIASVAPDFREGRKEA